MTKLPLPGRHLSPAIFDGKHRLVDPVLPVSERYLAALWRVLGEE